MKKKLLALLCALTLSLSLLPVPASASGLFFLSLNDTLAPQSTQTTPIQHSGWVYVPVNALSSRVTGVNFGVYYGLTDNNESLILYNLSGKNMTFDLANGTATCAGGESPVPDKVVQRNGLYYVPAYAVCRYFGLTYSFHSTEYGPLLRIKDSSAVLSDFLFLSSASSMMRSRYVSYYGQTQEPVTPVPEVEVPEVPEEQAPKFSLYLGLLANGDVTAALNAIAGVNASAVVFFPADTVAENRDQIRQAAGRGHKVGLIPAGATPEEELDSVRQGAALLNRILRQETWFVLSHSQTLAEAGYLCWSPGHTPVARGNATQIYQSIVDYGKGANGGRVLLDTRTAPAVLNGVLSQMRQDGDTFLTDRETRY